MEIVNDTARVGANDPQYPLVLDRLYLFWSRKMKIQVITGLFLLIMGLVAFSGCAVIQRLGGLGSTGQSVNYALADNGAAALASGYTPDHDPATAINGIKSSEGWDDGEGWENRFERRRPQGGWSRLDPKTTMEFGSAWLEVRFDRHRLINKVTVYTLDSPKYHAAQYGIRDAWLQLWKEYGWVIVGEVKDGAIVSRVSLERRPAGGKMVFKFDPVETDKIRFVIFRSNDVETVGQGWEGDRKTERSVARVVEIEATGIERISERETSTAWVKQAPEFALQDINNQWVRLSNFSGRVVIVTFWASWSPESVRQVRDLTRLHNQYKDQNVVVMGISVDEGGAERIRPFVEASNLSYAILIADTSVKTAYGGIGKLPSTFVIDQEGNIYKEYSEYQSSQILELDIKRLIPRG